ncbi:MAG: hypothetical protein BWX47_01980 [candidate division Hyd24-12 bacterium ADurb.Bin004]|nr:MAG: hypothetical protein BWX47_01980 [candidate division Hyd24-12 bacterium ADurb.Bin004]
MPRSTMRPPSSTSTRSASLIVASLCAITMLVLPARRRVRAFWILLSVLVSTLLVASSSTSTSGSARIALEIDNSCLCPWLRFDAPSERSVSYPLGSCLMKWSACAIRAASMHSSSVASSLPNLMFSMTVSAKRKVSCSTSARLPLRQERFISLMSLPSIDMTPEST